MAKFKQVPQRYLLDKLMAYWLNMVRNYRGNVRDNDFFGIVRARCPHERAVKFIEGVYSRDELEKMGKSRSRACRLDLSDGLEEVFILLYGAPGAGKTSFARTLAKELGRVAFEVRQEQFYLAAAQSNMDRIEALKEECAVKKDGGTPPRIGFAA